MKFEIVFKYFNFSIALFSMALMIEIFINFKKLNTLKILFISMVGWISIHNLSVLLNGSFFLNVISRFFILITGINILYFLYKFTLNKFILLLCALLFFLLIFLIKTDLIPWVDNSILNILSIAGRLLITIIFLYLYLNIYWKLLSSLNENNIYSKKLRKWIIFFIVFYIIAAINNIFLQFYPQQISIIRSLTIFTHLTICILIFYRPKFINRSELAISIGKTFRQNAIALIDDDKFKLEFHTNQYFLNPDASIENFTELMNVNASILNEYINQKTNLTFYDLVNKTRVEHFVAISSRNQYKNLTIEGLATLSGFGSKQTFYRNFKKFHGGSPSNLNKINE